MSQFVKLTEFKPAKTGSAFGKPIVIGKQYIVSMIAKDQNTIIRLSAKGKSNFSVYDEEILVKEDLETVYSLLTQEPRASNTPSTPASNTSSTPLASTTTPFSFTAPPVDEKPTIKSPTIEFLEEGLSSREMKKLVKELHPDTPSSLTSGPKSVMAAFLIEKGLTLDNIPEEYLRYIVKRVQPLLLKYSEMKRDLIQIVNRNN